MSRPRCAAAGASGWASSGVHRSDGGLPHFRPSSAQPTHFPSGPRWPGPPRVPHVADASPVNAWPAERFDRAGFPLSFHRAAQSRIGSRLACLPSPLGRARSCSDAKSGSLWTEDGSRPRRGRVSPREDTNLTPASVSQRKRRRCSDIDLAQA